MDELFGRKLPPAPSGWFACKPEELGIAALLSGEPPPRCWADALKEKSVKVARIAATGLFGIL